MHTPQFVDSGKCHAGCEEPWTWNGFTVTLDAKYSYRIRLKTD